MIQEKLEAANTGLEEIYYNANDSICRQVSNREPQMERFSQQHDVVLFVSGKKSSNGKALFGVCHNYNPRSYFIENEAEIDPSWFLETDSVGICGATSTPMWLMQQVADHIEKMGTETVVSWNLNKNSNPWSPSLTLVDKYWFINNTYHYFSIKILLFLPRLKSS